MRKNDNDKKNESNDHDDDHDDHHDHGDHDDHDDHDHEWVHRNYYHHPMIKTNKNDHLIISG